MLVAYKVCKVARRKCMKNPQAAEKKVRVVQDLYAKSETTVSCADGVTG